MRSRIATAVLAGCLLAAGIGNQARAIDADRVHPAPVGHRQPTARKVPTAHNSAERAAKKMDQDLDRKVKGICKGC
jgi:hypothetical protein